MRRGFSRVKGEQLIATFLSSTLTSPSLLSPPPLSIPSLTAHPSIGIQLFFNSPLSRCSSSSSASSQPSTPPFSPSSVSPMPGAGSQGVEWPADRVRDTFFRFFEEKNHVFWKSSPVVPVNDPTLLFANAGLSFFLVFVILLAYCVVLDWESGRIVYGVVQIQWILMGYTKIVVLETMCFCCRYESVQAHFLGHCWS